MHTRLKEELRAIAELDLPFEKFEGRTIAVTGATGLIGTYMMYALDYVRVRHNMDVKLVALCRDKIRASERLCDANAEIVEYDALKPLDSGLKADYIVHAASNAHPIAFSQDPIGTMRANLFGTDELLKCATRYNARLVFCSTGEIYGEREGSEGFREATFGTVDTMNARACYPESKRAAETLCAAYNKQCGTDAVVARLTYVYGPTITSANSRADAQFLRNALSGEDIVLKSKGEQLRSYTYVADAVSGLITLMLKGQSGQAYNVAHPKSAVRIRDYALVLAELAGVGFRFDLPSESEKSGFSAVKNAILNPEKLMALGWTPRYSLREGLGHTLEIVKCD